LGTLIKLALYKMIFRIPAFFMAAARRLLRGGKQNGEFLRFAQACCLCCIHSHERFFRYISKHLIVQMCIWSASFSTAAKRAFFTLFRHRAKIQNMDFLSTFLLFQTKVNCLNLFENCSSVVACLEVYLFTLPLHI
jgi:Plasma-membrane choline transporter.